MSGNLASRAWQSFASSWWGLLAVVGLGLALRLYHLDHQSVWYDEAFTLTVSRVPLSELTPTLAKDPSIAPLYSYLLHGWFQLFGFGSLQARLLSAVFGTLAIVPLYLLAAYLFDRPTALVAALLLAVSQLGVMYSQEARPYALLLFLVLCAAYCFIRALREKNARAWWGCVISVALMTLTHYYGVFAMMTLFLYAFLYRRRYALPWRWWVGGAAVFLLAWLPWLTSGVIGNALRSPKAAPAAQPSYFAIDWTTPFTTLNRFNNGATLGFTRAAPWWMFLLGGLLFTVPALLALKPHRTRESGQAAPDRLNSLLLLVLLWLVPVCCALSLFIINYPYDVKYVIFCAAPYYLLVARGVSALNVPLARRVLLAVIVAYSILSLRAVYYLPYKENYRDALAYVAEEYRAGDRCVFLPFGDVPLQWSVYQGGRAEPQLADLDGLASGQVRCERLWVVQYRKAEPAALRCEQGKRKLESTLYPSEERHYFWIDVCLYVPKDRQ